MNEEKTTIYKLSLYVQLGFVIIYLLHNQGKKRLPLVFRSNSSEGLNLCVLILLHSEKTPANLKNIG